MSGPFLRTKPKFGRLHAMLGISPQLARGLLEYLWDSVYDSGDPVIGDAAAVETAAGWDGEPGKLCEALLACGGGKAGFIEEVAGQPGIYQLHDLLEHTPADRIRKWVRQQERREKGQTISQVRAAAAHARWAKANARTCKPMQTDAACMPLQTCGPATAAEPEVAVNVSVDRRQPSETSDPAAAPLAAIPLAVAPLAADHEPLANPLPVTSRQPLATSPPPPAKPSFQEVYDYFKSMNHYGDVLDFIAKYQLPPADANPADAESHWQMAAYRYVCKDQARLARECPNDDAYLRLGGKQLKGALANSVSS